MKDVEFTIFDLEWVTRRDRKSFIVEIGAIKFRNGEITGRFNKLLQYLKPIDPVIVELTGITNQMLKFGANREKTILEFLLFIENTVLVAHDIKNDMIVLNAESERLGLLVPNPNICTLKLSEQMFLIEKYNLQAVAKFLGVKTLGKHRAFKDATILYEIFMKMLLNLPKNIDTVQEMINLNKGRKKLIKSKFDLIKLDTSKSYVGFFDGASAGNPGKMGSGFVIFDENKKPVIEGAEYIGVGTNNEAEYQAVISLLQFAVQHKIENLAVFGDSKLVIKQILGEWKVKAENLKPYVREAQKLTAQIPNIVMEWIPREQNTYADRLSKKGVDAE